MHFTKMKSERMKLLHLKSYLVNAKLNGIMLSKKKNTKKTKPELWECYLLRTKSEHTDIGNKLEGYLFI